MIVVQIHLGILATQYTHCLHVPVTAEILTKQLHIALTVWRLSLSPSGTVMVMALKKGMVIITFRSTENS